MKTNLEPLRRYKEHYDKTAATPKFQIGDWVLVHFAQEETGKMQKLSQPWHGPYRIVSRDDPDVTVIKLYFPDDPKYKFFIVEFNHVHPYSHEVSTGTEREDLGQVVHPNG